MYPNKNLRGLPNLRGLYLSTEAQILALFGVQTFRFGRDQMTECQI